MKERSTGTAVTPTPDTRTQGHSVSRRPESNRQLRPHSTQPRPATINGSTRGPQTAAPHPRRRVADRTGSAHTRRRAPRSRTHPKQVVAQRRAVHSVVPRPRRRAHCRAPPVARCMQRPLVVQVCSRSSTAPTSRSAVPAPALKSTSTACAHGAPSRAPTQRSTPDAGVNARSQRALYSAGSHAPQTRPRAPCPGAAASAAGEAGTRGAYAHAPALRGAPPRKARERGRDGRSAGGGRVRGSG